MEQDQSAQSAKAARRLLPFLAGAMALAGVIAVLFGRTARAGASPSSQFPAQASNYGSLGSGDAGGSSFALCFAFGAWLALTFVRAARRSPLKLALSCREADLEGLRQ